MNLYLFIRDVEQSDYYRKVTEGKLPVLWMSPESLFDGVSSTKSDVWSYGVLLWEIVTCGERPYTGVATEALLDLIKDGYRMSIPLQCPQNLYQIMKITEKDPGHTNTSATDEDIPDRALDTGDSVGNPFPLLDLHLLESAVLYHPEADLYTLQAFQTVGR